MDEYNRAIIRAKNNNTCKESYNLLKDKLIVRKNQFIFFCDRFLNKYNIG